MESVFRELITGFKPKLPIEPLREEISGRVVSPFHPSLHITKSLMYDDLARTGGLFRHLGNVYYNEYYILMETRLPQYDWEYKQWLYRQQLEEFFSGIVCVQGRKSPFIDNVLLIVLDFILNPQPLRVSMF